MRMSIMWRFVADLFDLTTIFEGERNALQGRYRRVGNALCRGTWLALLSPACGNNISFYDALVVDPIAITRSEPVLVS